MMLKCLALVRPWGHLYMLFYMSTLLMWYDNQKKQTSLSTSYGSFPKWWLPLYRWMVHKGKSDLEMDDLGVPLFQETFISPSFVRSPCSFAAFACVPCMRVKICPDMAGNVIRVSSSYFPAFCRTCFMMLVHLKL